MLITMDKRAIYAAVVLFHSNTTQKETHCDRETVSIVNQIVTPNMKQPETKKTKNAIFYGITVSDDKIFSVAAASVPGLWPARKVIPLSRKTPYKTTRSFNPQSFAVARGYLALKYQKLTFRLKRNESVLLIT
ncbi:hypothetical protein HDF24_07515 [Mucilaginibacter sp. X4EP1]|uniref:hypothetical protein n=1 Tax=Mucilaginibacter sp. X4EP1 TaxID=2723092 RepID=UPI003B00FE74